MSKTTNYLMESAPGTKTIITGQDYLYFGGTGYYELQGHAALIDEGISIWKKSGTNTAASRRGMGTAPIHLKVEEDAARYFGTEDAIYIASGYLSNTAGLQALYEAGVFDVIYIDEHSHYCVVDAARSIGIEIYTFAHRDPENLLQHLIRTY